MVHLFPRTHFPDLIPYIPRGEKSELKTSKRGMGTFKPLKSLGVGDIFPTPAF